MHVTPARLQRSKVSSSRFDPPGCTIFETPASIGTVGPSGNGKNASLAATAPLALPPAFSTASRHALTRSTCPPPPPQHPHGPPPPPRPRRASAPPRRPRPRPRSPPRCSPGTGTRLQQTPPPALAPASAPAPPRAATA